MVSFRFTTKTQFLSVLRDRYRQAQGLQAARIAKWLKGNLTTKEARDLLGAESAARLDAKAQKLDSIENERGE